MGTDKTVVSVHVMKAHGGVEVQLHSFLTSPLNEGEESASRPSHFNPGKYPHVMKCALILEWVGIV
jgi:hypothetical protein